MKDSRIRNIPRIALLVGLVLGACDRPEAPAAAVAPEAPSDTALNPVQREMRLLDEAIRTSITAIANAQPQTALPSIERVHEARTATEHYLESGAWAALSQPDSLAAFMAADGEFHARLEHYAHALQEGELRAAAAALSPLLETCVACHERFRQ